MSQQDRVLPMAWVLLAILTLMWGSSFILIKRGLEVFSAGEVGGLRMLAASLVMTPIALQRIKTIKLYQAKYILTVGFVGSFLPAILFATAQTRIDSYMAGVLNALTPMFVVLIGALVYHQRFPIRTGIGILIGFLGTVLLMTTGSDGLFSGLNLYGLFIVLACLFYGMNGNIIKYNLSGVPALTITSLSMFFVLPVVIIYLFGMTDFTTTFRESEGALRALGYVVFLGIMSTAIAVTLFNKLVQMTNPVFTSSVTYLLPIVAVLWGLFDNEVLLPGHYLAMLTILVGVYITNRR